jgi:hypothetical protein
LFLAARVLERGSLEKLNDQFRKIKADFEFYNNYLAGKRSFVDDTITAADYSLGLIIFRHYYATVDSNFRE